MKRICKNHLDIYISKKFRIYESLKKILLQYSFEFIHNIENKYSDIQK